MNSTVPVVPQDQTAQTPQQVAVQSPVTVQSIPQDNSTIPQSSTQSLQQYADEGRNQAMNAMLNQVAQNLPQSTQPDTLNPQHPSPSTKENPLVVSPEMATELPSGMQSVEALRSPEISPEVEKFIEDVREEPSQLPQEVVVADQKVSIPTGGFAAQPVIVLPMTEEGLKEAEKAPPTESKRWLAEWTKKIIKIFTGKVVYRG